MKCKYCGHALSNNQATCPHCGMLMTEDQLKRRKEINGVNNPYMQRLNELNKNKHKLEKNEEHINIKPILIVIAILLLILIIGYLNLIKGN